MGSFRRSPDGHRVIGWGFMVFNGRAMTELNNAGQPVLDISLGQGNGVYRAIEGSVVLLQDRPAAGSGRDLSPPGPRTRRA